MACVEHECQECGYFQIDNQRYSACPKCGGRITNLFDEHPWEYDRDTNEPDSRDEENEE